MNANAVFILLVTALCCPLCPAERCVREDIQKCISMADPLIKVPSYVFPTNQHDMDHVCNTWNHFVICVERYTASCLSRQEQKDFNQAVQDSINNVHLMCRDTRYQEEYLTHAPCIKSMSTEDNHCGCQYRRLVDQVSGNSSSSEQMCCSHQKYRECLVKQSTDVCGVPAANFAENMLDKALGFLLKQCDNYIPNSGDCPDNPSGRCARVADYGANSASWPNRHPEAGGGSSHGELGSNNDRRDNNNSGVGRGRDGRVTNNDNGWSSNNGRVDNNDSWDGNRSGVSNNNGRGTHSGGVHNEGRPNNSREWGSNNGDVSRNYGVGDHSGRTGNNGRWDNTNGGTSNNNGAIITTTPRLGSSNGSRSNTRPAYTPAANPTTTQSTYWYTTAAKPASTTKPWLPNSGNKVSSNEIVDKPHQQHLSGRAQKTKTASSLLLLSLLGIFLMQHRS